MEDRISQLPEFINHYILSFLNSPADLVRISVLSKQWFALTASFPILDFNFHSFMAASGILLHTREDIRHAKDKFFEYVAYTMSRILKQNVSAHTFKLIVELQKPTEIDIFDRWIGLIVEKDVQVLVLEILPKTPLCGDHYSLPNTLLSASSLTSLKIRRCKLPSSVMVDGVKFKCLKLLSLSCMPIDEEVINYLTTSCPLLEEFKVKRCYGFKRFCVNGHQNLQKVRIYFECGVETIDIEAPNLNYLRMTILRGRGAPCINMASCKKLKTLSFYGDSSSISQWFAEFLSNFPLIENLFLDIPTQHNNLKVSSHSLRKFVLHPQCDLEGIVIDAPNMLLFQYTHDSHAVPFSLASSSAQLKACMECHSRGYVDAFWFQTLRQFLDKKNGFKVLKLHIRADVIDFHELEVIPPPPFELEHVEVNLYNKQELSVYIGIVDAVLRCCCPRSLTLGSYFLSNDFEERSHVVKLIYETLQQQEDQGPINIQIVLSSASKAKKHFSNLNSLLRAFPCDRQERIITFIKEGDALFIFFDKLISFIHV